jgi:hypothetical protein
MEEIGIVQPEERIREKDLRVILRCMTWQREHLFFMF